MHMDARCSLPVYINAHCTYAELELLLLIRVRLTEMLQFNKYVSSKWDKEYRTVIQLLSH